LVDWQIDSGIEGLVPCGTTGESATLSADERQQVIQRVVDRAGSKAVVIAGAGSNCTAVAVEHQKRAKDTGARYALVVTPYYNKPSPAGLFQHYEALWKAADIPIIAYNVPGRTACDMPPDMVARLAELEGVVGIKEATAELPRVAALRHRIRKPFALLSGDDATACPFVLMGGDGCISVASNVAPKTFGDMLRAARAGKTSTAREIHMELAPLFTALFIESNPIPVKAALAMQKRLAAHYRLPLCAMETQHESRLRATLSAGVWI
jgi:4-hydroxy-tetrahydrodipicolinate synthase